MSSTLLLEPEVQETTQSLAEPVERKAPVLAAIQAKVEANPMVIVFVACVIAFHLAAAMIGSVAAWIYCLRDSGAFVR